MRGARAMGAALALGVCAAAGAAGAEDAARSPGGMIDAGAPAGRDAARSPGGMIDAGAPAGRDAARSPGEPDAIARALFHGGDSTVRVGVAGMAPTLPARRFPCANCHGADGMGGTEGARAVPPIVPVGRPAMDARLILSALTQGTGAGGRRLDPLMPRYDIGPPEAEALAAFLAALPAQERRGIAADSITLRFAPPPMAAPLAESFAAGFAAAVAGRAPWGRRIVLADGDAPAFAALGFGGGDDPGLPLIAPLGPAENDGPLRALCASFEAEIDALLATLSPGEPLRVMGEGPLADRARGIAERAGHAPAGDAGAPVLLLARAEAGKVPPGARVLGIAAHLHGPVLQGLVRGGPVQDGLTQDGLAQDGLARDGPVRGGPVQDGLTPDGPVRDGLVQDGLTRDGPVRGGPVQAGRRVTLSDGCARVAGIAAGPDAGRERARQLGAAAGEAVSEALARSGRNLTRVRFLTALEQAQPPLSERGAAPVVTEHPPGR